MSMAARFQLRIGTAGWTMPASCRPVTAEQGSHLERYARMLNAVEINSSFHRPHRHQTYVKWAHATPEDFRFAVKVPKSISHTDAPSGEDIERFVDESAGLGEKLALLLVQFPPAKAFDPQAAAALFERLQRRTAAALVCEPRHPSWFTQETDQWFAERAIARVAADPARGTLPLEPGGWPGLRYFRLHGSPRMYHSSYADDFLQKLADRLTAAAASGLVWCIFDNTALGAATTNALHLQENICRETSEAARLHRRTRKRSRRSQEAARRIDPARRHP